LLSIVPNFRTAAGPARAARLVAVVATAAPLAFSAACAPGSDAQPADTAATAQRAAERAAPARHVRVGLTEWSVLTSTDRVRPGTVRLTVTNTGATEHDLVVQGRADRWHTEPLDPGGRARLTVQARPGEVLRLWCSEPGHESQGMHTTLTVTG
jgi:uncharacterized cupredoxin-like copper-binding protein